MNNLKIYAGIFCAVLLWAAPASPQDQPDCTSPQTQTDMNTCADQDFAKADEELNSVWEDAKTNSENDDETGEQSKALQDAQRNWLAYRDSECIVEGLAAAGGSMQPMLISSCKAQMTNDRVKQLHEYIDGPQ
jgi:uncharacterized protein YecT (DUF1311 family)